MKFISSASLLLLAVAPVAVQSHSVQVRYCVTPDLNLRIFIEHWHGDLTDPNSAGSLDFTDNIANTTTSLQPIGTTINTTSEDLWRVGGCGGPTNVVTTCNNEYQDWVYYDFAMGTCEVTVSYTINTGPGTTLVLADGCLVGNVGLYPATINATPPCPSEWPSMQPSVSSAPSTAPTTYKASKSSGKGKGGKSEKTSSSSLRSQDIVV